MKIKLFTTHSDGSVISYLARAVVAGAEYQKPGVTWFEIPARVRALPFPPYDGKRYVAFSTSQIENRFKA